jgi:hypothetical protein
MRDEPVTLGDVHDASDRVGLRLDLLLEGGWIAAHAQGDDGPRGPQGDPGAPGQAGPAGTARAYALVDVTSGADPILVQPYVKEFTSVRRTGTGFYCVHPAAGIDPATMPAIVNAEFGFSGGSDLKAYWEQGHCNADEYQVVTEQGGGAKSNDVAFTILVP